jgi:hypothetical protein
LEIPIIKQKTMRATGIFVLTHNLAGLVDPDGCSETGIWEVQRYKVDSIEQKPMDGAISIEVLPHNLAGIINPIGKGISSPWNINSGKVV